MKKIIAIILATVFVVLALASCNNNTTKPDASTPAGNKPGTPAQSTPVDPDATPESTPDMTPDNTTFDTRDETVYVFNAENGLKLRTSNNFVIDNVAHIVANGTELKRIGVGIEDPSVSKVVYNGVEFYCGSKYLTTEAPDSTESTGDSTVDDTPVEFIDTDQTVTVLPDNATVYTEAYKGWAPDNKKNTANFVLTKDTEVKVTGVCYEDETDLEVGWARIEYNSETYYVRISVLSKIAVPTTPAESTPAATEAN